MKIAIPHSLKLEHEELHAALEQVRETSGLVGDAARRITQLLHPHFAKEEEFALPPLGLLMTLEKGMPPPEAAQEALRLTDRLKREMPRMLEEHKAIVAALMEMVMAAKREKKHEYMELAERLMLHAQSEEEVLYPAALLIGEYLRLKLAR